MIGAPSSDRELDEAIVRRVMEDQFPDLRLESVQHLGSGWEYDAYLVDRRLAVRFPRYADVAKHLTKVETRLRFVAGELGASVAVPKIVLRGEPGPHFPHRFFGHEVIPGVTAAELGTPPPAALAPDLGRALTAIHAVSAERAAALGVGPQKWTCRTAFEGLVDVLDEVPQVATLSPEGAAWVRAAPGPHPAYAGPPRFIHDDFQPEHVIVDPDSGRLTGVIDWGGRLGDPGQDFSFVVAWAGWDFTRSVLSAYTAPRDTEFLSRILFLGRVRALGWLAYAVQAGLDPTPHVEVARDLMSRPEP